jgi:hypothetical protein
MAVRRSASRVQASNDDAVARAGRATEDSTVVEMRVHLAGVKETINDHETRIRELEAAKAKLLGACLVLAALAGSASGWLALVLMHH